MIAPTYRTYVPGEARILAGEFRAAADQVRRLARQLENIRNRLNGEWEGKSKRRYFEQYDPEIKQLYHYADWLLDRAREIEKRTVTVRV